MLLRTRVTLIVFSAYLASALIISLGLAYAAQMSWAYLNEVIVQSEAALFKSNTRMLVAGLEASASGLAESPDLTYAIASNSPAEIRDNLVRYVGRLPDGQRPSHLEVATSDGQVVQTWPVQTQTRGLLDQTSLQRLANGEHVTGLRATESNRYLLIASVPVRSQAGVIIAYLTVGKPAAALMAAFSQANQTDAALVGLRGQLVESTNSKLWTRVRDAITLREFGRTLVREGSFVATVSSLPITDASGALTGTIVAYRDTSETFANFVVLAGGLAGVVALLVIITIALLSFHLSASFRPLTEAVAVTTAIADGDLSRELSFEGSDEIGRISQAIRRLRSNALAANEYSRQRERTRRRRERLIRREVTVLADALEPADRKEILGVLEQGSADMAALGANAGSTSSNQQLRLIAGVLRELVSRILKQRGAMATMIAQLEEALATKDKLAGLQQQLAIAKQVQAAILPRDYSTDPRVSIHGQMTPASEVGGDFFDCFMIDRDTLVVLIADVSGKGVPAAIFMAITRTLIRAIAQYSDGPASLLQDVNDLLAKENDQMLFVTISLGFLDLTTGTYTFVRGGHDSPLLRRLDGSVIELPAVSGVALAVVEGMDFEVGTIRLAPGELLLLSTDGITEAQAPDGSFFGAQRLLTILKDHGDGDERGVCETIEAEVRVFEAGCPATDDLTCVAMRYTGVTSATETSQVAVTNS